MKSITLSIALMLICVHGFSAFGYSFNLDSYVIAATDVTEPTWRIVFKGFLDTGQTPDGRMGLNAARAAVAATAEDILLDKWLELTRNCHSDLVREETDSTEIERINKEYVTLLSAFGDRLAGLPVSATTEAKRRTQLTTYVDGQIAGVLLRLREYRRVLDTMSKYREGIDTLNLLGNESTQLALNETHVIDASAYAGMGDWIRARDEFLLAAHAMRKQVDQLGRDPGVRDDVVCRRYLMGTLPCYIEAMRSARHVDPRSDLTELFNEFDEIAQNVETRLARNPAGGLYTGLPEQLAKLKSQRNSFHE